MAIKAPTFEEIGAVPSFDSIGTEPIDITAILDPAEEERQIKDAVDMSMRKDLSVGIVDNNINIYTEEEKIQKKVNGFTNRYVAAGMGGFSPFITRETAIDIPVRPVKIAKEITKGIARFLESGVGGTFGGTAYDWLGQFIEQGGYAVDQFSKLGSKNKDQIYNPFAESIIATGQNISKWGKESRKAWAEQAAFGWEALDPTLKESDPISYGAGRLSEGVASSGLSVLAVYLSGGVAAPALLNKGVQINRGLVALSTMSAAGGFEHAQEQGENFLWSTVQGLADGGIEYAMETSFLEGIGKGKKALTAGFKEGGEEFVTGMLQNTRATLLENEKAGMSAYAGAKDAIIKSLKQSPWEIAAGFIGGYGMQGGANLTEIVNKWKSDVPVDIPTATAEGGIKLAPPTEEAVKKPPTEPAKVPEAPAKAITEAKPTITPAEAKQPWEMDANTYAVSVKGLKHPEISRTKLLAEHPKTETSRQRLLDEVEAETKQYILAEKEHKGLVRKAVSEGKSVPREVLEEYKSEKWAQEALARAKAEAKPVEKKPKKEAGFVEIEKTVKAMKAPARWFLSVFEPAKLASRKHGKEAVATVMRAIHKPEAQLLEYGAKELESLDKSYNQAEEWLNTYPKEVQEAVMLTRGHGLEAKARGLQKKAFASLPKELKESEVRRALDEIADFNYEYLSEIFGEEIETLFGTDIVNNPGYVQDYFYGVYKNPKKINNFLSFWKTTDKYTKHKVFPTYADAKAYGLEIKDPNPVTNLKAEYRAISYKASMIWLKDELMRLGEGRYIMPKEEAPINWETIGGREYADPTFSDVLVEPDMAKLINNLISTNKISQFKALRILRDVNNFLRTIKFVGSAFHMVQIAKQSVADSGYLGFYKATATRGLTKGFEKNDPIFQTPEYKWYIENGGGHQYAVESQARKVFVDTLSKLTKSEQYIIKIGTAPLRLPVGFVDWMFNSYIPKVKYSKYLDVVTGQEKKLDRSLTAAETQEIIKEAQNFYGMMNERLFGRSGTITGALRFVFIAPGYAEGNYRTMIKAAFQWGQGEEGFRAGRSRVNILNSWIVTATVATVGTLILTGKPPKEPETIEEIRDLLKIDTGKKDEYGNRIMIDMATYDKDYWDVAFNTLRGRPDIAVTNAITRIGGMKAPTAKMISDLYDMMQGKTLYDWKDDKVYHITDPFLQKFGKLIAHETRELIPISASVYKQSRKRGIDKATAAIETLLGLRPGRTERDKKEFEIVRDIWDMRDKREKLSYKLNSYDDPWGAVEIYNKTLDSLVDNKFITDDLKKQIEGMKIDPEKVITWKRFPINRLTVEQIEISIREHTYKENYIDAERNRHKRGDPHKGWEDRVKNLKEELKKRS